MMGCSLKTQSPNTCVQNVPFQIKGCEGEMCSVIAKKYPANQEVKLYKRPDLGSEVVETISKCEKFRNIEQFLLISDFNQAKVTKAEGELKKYKIQPGDTIQITHYTGEGTWGACIKNDFVEGIGIKGEHTEAYDEAEFLNKEIKRPKSWVYVTSIRKKSGWTDKVFWVGKYDDEQIILKECKTK